MALPTRKHTRSRRDKRRTHWKLTSPSLTRCQQCARVILMHRACPGCGFYRGRPTMKIREKKEARAAKAAKS